MVGIMVFPTVGLCQQLRPGYDPMTLLPVRFFGQISQTAQTIQGKLDKQATRYLHKILRQEQRLKRKLARKDTAAAHELFGKTTGYYQQLKQTVNNTTSDPPYIPFLDTLQTSLLFLQQNPSLLQEAKGATDRLTQSMGDLQALEKGFQQTATLQAILQQRHQYLREKLQGLGLGKEIGKLNKQVYYYSQQVNEYKEILKHPAKIERKALDLLSNTRVFQDFMRRHSRLAALFRLPGSDDNAFSGISYASLQTREQVSGMIQQQLAAGGPQAQQQFQQQLQTAQAELSKLKDKILKAGSNGVIPGREEDMPNFKPNTQKTKSFKQRLELGTNIQSQKATNYFPVTTDIAISLGYKLNDRSIVGIGAAYKLGWGQGWDHIQITHQGAGIRSFIDWQIKNSFWFSGGFEMNYRPLNVSNVTGAAPGIPMSPPKSDTWQRSGLFGLSKNTRRVKVQRQNTIAMGCTILPAGATGAAFCIPRGL
ncbi:hypothetical protein [Paraflavitalea speifideaquila]|uniref:hypothetical protein n=1 Tax=Paraflavitalea speifideaquila TaxID=3076558 RepID=UPI0028E64AB2|nr:hypothetical protein [Paraflavitalea speifideiaquila]